MIRMIRWIFWLIVLFWLVKKLKFLLEDKVSKNCHFSDSSKTRHFGDNTDKKISDKAGDYIDFEEIK